MGATHFSGPIFSGNGFVGAPASEVRYTVATVPDATLYEGAVIYVSDGAAGGPTLAFSDGTDWLSVTAGAAISGAP